MKLFLYRLSLTLMDEGTLFEQNDETPESRKSFLKRCFRRSFVFDYRKGIRLKYQYIQTDSGVIAGAICRWVSEDEEGDPTDPFAVTEGGRWHKATFFLNYDGDEQVIGIEKTNRVGLPQSIVRSLIEVINSTSSNDPYKIDVFSVSQKGSFNEAVASYPGPITRLTFELVVPNPMNVAGTTKEALKALREKTNMDRLKETLISEEGLKTNSDYVEDLVDYATDGHGDVVAKSGPNTVFDSSMKVRSVDVDEQYRPTGEKIDGISDSVKPKLKR